MAKTLRDNKINQIIYISLGGVVVAIILFIILFNIFSSKKNNVEIGENSSGEVAIEEANSSIGKTVDEAKNSDYTNDEQSVQVKINDETQSQEPLSEELSEQDVTINNNDIAQSTENSNSFNIDDSVNIANSTNEINSASESSIENDNQVEEIKKDPTFIMPVEGEIVKHYGKEKLIYSDTLKEWTTHLGIDIKADKTTVVKSSADGSVKSIKNDPRYGLTVVVEHDNGFTSVYSNLLTAEFVVVGETVKAGQTLGTVGNSATFEILDDAHLHFEILKDGNSVDPEMYIK